MTSELRPAVEVVIDILNAAERAQFTQRTKLQNAVGHIEADREAVRAEQAAELAKFKALAETLAGALEPFAKEWDEREFLAQRHWSFYREASKAIAEYKEARDV